MADFCGTCEDEMFGKRFNEYKQDYTVILCEGCAESMVVDRNGDQILLDWVVENDTLRGEWAICDRHGKTITDDWARDLLDHLMMRNDRL